MVGPALPSFSETSLMLSEESGACTLVSAVAELLPGTGSSVADVTLAVLTMIVPPAPLAFAIKVMVADEPLARDEKVIVRLLPAPPHMPPPVVEHETKITELGRLSVTT